MADGHAYRFKFYLTNVVLLVIAAVILLLVFATKGFLGAAKSDWTRDSIYTISDATKEIFGGLIDKVQVDYYVSDPLPSHLESLKRDTRALFEEFKDVSDGNLAFAIINPEDEADQHAAEKVEEYYKKKKDGETPEEPEPVRTIQQMFSQQQGPTPEEIRKARDDKARAIAENQEGRTKDDVFRELLLADYKRNFLQKLEQEGIAPFPLTEREASSVRQVDVYSCIVVRYLDKQQEVIPVHYSIEALEYELASRVLKLTQETKPVVLFFDARRPDAPPPNMGNPMQMPQSDYVGIEQFLGRFFDVRSLDLKKDNGVDEVVERIKEAAERKKKEDAKEDVPEDFSVTVGDEDVTKYIKCVVVAQPDNLEPRQAYEINRVASLGVPTILFVSPFTMDISQDGSRQGIPITTLSPGQEFDDMLRGWGLELGSDILASNAPYCGPAPLLTRIAAGLPPMLMERPIPVNVAPADESLSQTSGFTNRIQQVVFPATAGFKVNKSFFEDNKDLKLEQLASTPKQTWSHKVDPFKRLQNPLMRNQGVGTSVYENREELLEFKEDGYTDFVDPVPLALRLQGKIPFTFEGKDVPAWKDPPPPEEGAPGGLPPNPHGGGLPFGLGDQAVALNPDDPQNAGDAQGDGETAPAVPPVVQQPDATPPAPETPAPVTTEPPAQTPVPVTPDAATPDTDTSGTVPSGTVPSGTVTAPETTGADGSEAPAEPPAKAHVDVAASGDVLLLASADMFKNEFLTMRSAEYQSNIRFIQNAVETYGLGTLLLEIRRKQLTTPRFKPESDQKSALIIAINVLLVPVAVAVFGLLLWLIRRSRSQAYERRYIAAQ